MSALATANPRNFGVKRLMKEYAEFQKAEAAHENDYFTAAPCEDNLFEWHFTIRGPPDSDFAGGRYHGRILLPSQYPFKPPDIMMLTPSGRFETNKKICLSISSFHPANWQPSWSIRTVLTALIAFFPTPGNGAIGSLEYSSFERREFASRSAAWRCDLCEQSNVEMLPDLPPGALERAAAPKLSKEVQDMIDANKAAAAAAGAASQPATPAQGPTAAPATPVQLAVAQQIVADAPPTPLLTRTHSDPTGSSSPVGVGELTLAATTTTATGDSASSSAPTQSPQSLVLDEGLRQRQGRVIAQSAASAAAETVSLAPPVPAVAAPSPVAPAPAVPAAAPAPAPPAADRPLSAVTVFLACLILLILARKLYASTQAKQTFSFDFSQD